MRKAGRQFDLGFALPRSSIKGLGRARTGEEQKSMAKAVVGQLKLCKEDVNEVTLRGRSFTCPIFDPVNRKHETPYAPSH